MCALVSRLGAVVLTGLLSMVLAHPAAAISTTFDFDFDFAIDGFTPDLAGYQQFFGSQSGMLPQFDDQGSFLILEQVTLDLMMTIDGSVVYSDGLAGEYPGYIEPHFFGSAQANSLSVQLLNSDFAPAPGGQALPIYFTVVGTGTDAAGIPSDDLSSFIGTDLVDVFVQAGVNIPFTVPAITLGPTRAFGTASLTYVSRPIPEPNSAVLFGVGVLVVGAVLRKKAVA